MKKIRSIANLSFAIACSLGAYLFVICNTNDDKADSKEEENSLFSNVKINSFDANNNRATIESEKIKQIDIDKIELVNTKADLNYNSSNGQISAGSIISQGDKCEMKSDITLELSDGLKITTDFADVNIKDKTAKANKKIFIDYKDAHITANAYDLSLERIILSKNVTASQKDVKVSCDSFIGLIGKKNDKYTLTEGKLNGQITYTSNAYNLTTNGIVRYKDNKLFFDNTTKIEGTSNRKKFVLSSNKITIFLAENNTLKKAICENGFSLKVDGNTITAANGTYENNIITAEGDVSIKGPHGLANCKKAVYNTISGKLNMTNTGGVIFRKKN